MSSTLSYKVVGSFPEEDEAYPVGGVGDGKGHTAWVTAGVAKKATLDVVFTRNARLHTIEVSNNGASFVEVLVSGDGGFGDLRPLVSIQGLRGSQDVKSGSNITAKRVFDRTKMHILHREEKWKGMRVILTQPFPPYCPIGLCGLVLRDQGEEVVQKKSPLKKSDTEVLLPMDIDILTDEDEEQPLDILRSLSGSKMKLPSTPPRKKQIAAPPPVTPPRQKKPIVPEGIAERYYAPSPLMTPPKKKTEFKGIPMTFPEDDEVEELLSNSPGKPVAVVDKMKPMRPQRDVLKNVSVVLSGFQNPLRSELRDIALQLGGKYLNNWGDGGTHLVCAFPNTPKHQEVTESGKGYVVTKQWLYDSRKHGKMMPPSKYRMQAVVDDEDSDGISESSSFLESSDSSGTVVESTEESLFSSGDESESESESEEEEEVVKKKNNKRKLDSKKAVGPAPKKLALEIDDSDSQKTDPTPLPEIETGLKILEDAVKGMEPTDLRVDTLVVNTSRSSSSGLILPPPLPKLKPLPTFLKGVTLHTSCRATRKQVVTNGGRASPDPTNCTHVIVTKDTPPPKGPCAVNAQWLEDCLKNKRIMPASKYRP